MSLTTLIGLINTDLTQSGSTDHITGAELRQSLLAVVDTLSKDVAFSMAIPFNRVITNMGNNPCTSNIVFTADVTDATVGMGTIMELVGDGTHSPVWTNFTVLQGTYDPTKTNLIIFIKTPTGYGVNIFQTATAPVSDTTPPIVTSRATSDSTHISIVFAETVTGTLVGWSFKRGVLSLVPTAVTGSGTNTLVFTVATILNGDVLTNSYDSTIGDTKDTSNNVLASFTDQIVTNGVGLTTPAAPTAGTVNDQLGIDSFDYTHNSSYPNITDEEFTVDGGATYNPVTAKPIIIGNIAKAIGQVGVRVKAHTGTNPSATLFNTAAFTATLNAPVLTPGTPTSTTFPLTWTDTNSNPNESSFEYQQSIDSGANWTAANPGTAVANSTSANATGLVGNTNYSFRVRAVGNGSTTTTSPWSNIVSGSTITDNSLTINTSTNATYTGGVLSPTTGGGTAWHLTTVLWNKKLALGTDGYLEISVVDNDDQFAMIGFKTTAVESPGPGVGTGYASYFVALWLETSTFTIAKIENGNPTAPVTGNNAFSLGDKIRLNVTGSTIKCQKLVGGVGSPVDIFTFTNTRTQDLFPVSDVRQDGELEQPQGVNLI